MKWLMSDHLKETFSGYLVKTELCVLQLAIGYKFMLKFKATTMSHVIDKFKFQQVIHKRKKSLYLYKNATY